jgi:hypothetical protein
VSLCTESHCIVGLRDVDFPVKCGFDPTRAVCVFQSYIVGVDRLTDTVGVTYCYDLPWV